MGVFTDWCLFVFFLKMLYEFTWGSPFPEGGLPEGWTSPPEWERPSDSEKD